LGFRLLRLQPQIDLVEGGKRRADIDVLSDLDQALEDLAGDPKAQIAFDPRPDRADCSLGYRPRNARSRPVPGAPARLFAPRCRCTRPAQRPSGPATRPP